MFVFNLCPMPLKVNSQIYSWMLVIALQNFKADEIVLLGTKNQLRKPSETKYEDWIQKSFLNNINLKELDQKFEKCRKITVPDYIVNNAVDSYINPIKFFEDFVNIGINSYLNWLVDEIQDKINEGWNVLAFITWINDKTIEDVAKIINKPVIHMEGGNLRLPTAKISTFYFDFKGVNGNTSAENRSYEANLFKINYAMNLNELRKYIFKEEVVNELREIEEDIFEIGIPLQVEDDSNVLVFNNNYSLLDIMYLGVRFFPKEKVLIRKHPMATLKIEDENKFGITDCSKNSLYFSKKCKRIITLNSSVALDGLLLGKNVFIFGNSPMSYMANNSIDRKLKIPKNKINLDSELVWYVIGYLIPYKFWMNPDYIKWRLTYPTEEEIFLKHKEVWDEVN